MRFRALSGHVVAALAGVAAFHVVWREVTLKIADQVMVRADFPGFRDLAADHPFGAVDWCARMLAASDLAGWGVLAQLALVAAAGALACLALRRRATPFAPFAPWLAAAIGVLPALSLGEGAWLLPHPHFAQLHLVWFMVLAACLCAGWRGLVAFAALQAALVLAGRCAFDDLCAAETLRAAWALPLGVEWDARSVCALLPFVALAALAFVPRGVCASRPGWLHAAPPVLFGALFALSLPRRDCRDALAMERAVRGNRFADVLEIAPNKPSPSCLETAWRILAMYRLDRLDRDLWRYPVAMPDSASTPPESTLSGPLLLFHYGFVLPARRWTFEHAAVKGWQPQDYRLLGDVALVTGEEELARKNFEELARCPFRGDFAKRRLAELDARPRPTDAFADLADVVGMYDVWRKFAEEAGAPPYFGGERDAGRFVRGYYLQLKACPPPMLKMLFAAALLEGRPDVLKDNRNAMRELYPDGRIGPVFQEALK